MQVETLEDVLDWTTALHRNLSGCLADCAKANDDKRASMLLDYLAEHEQRLSGLVDQFEVGAETKALNTWCYDYMDKHPILHSTRCDVPFQDMDAKEIMDVVSGQHQQVIDLYRYLHARADIDATRDLMEKLKSLEEHEAMQMTQAANRLLDL
ncbi:ATPase [Microbulbifer sp. M83]|uniref:ATPase n=1 Tax=Microbulbifer sp. M83 TaxID=3118246 RepID=UPI002FDF90EF